MDSIFCSFSNRSQPLTNIQTQQSLFFLSLPPYSKFKYSYNEVFSPRRKKNCKTKKKKKKNRIFFLKNDINGCFCPFVGDNIFH